MTARESVGASTDAPRSYRATGDPGPRALAGRRVDAGGGRDELLAGVPVAVREYGVAGT